MTFADYWQQLQQKNPGLRNLDARMALSVESFRKAMEQAFIQGQEAGAAGASLFEMIFGKQA